MTLKFIHDNKGNTTGVFIPIEEWQSLKQNMQICKRKKRKT